MRVAANGVAIEVDDAGPASAEPILLVMGLGMQLTAWPDAFVRLLVQRGFRVVRFDNRDAGLSEDFGAGGTPNLTWAALRWMLRLPVQAPYRLADMARDAVGVLDALGIASAHVCGASLGGMVAQHVAASTPDRVRSLALMMTTSGARTLPQPGWDVRRALMARPAKGGRDAVVDHLVRVMQLVGSPAHAADPAELRARLSAAVARAWRPDGTVRQMLAVGADGDRTPLLARIRAPTVVIHGDADALIPVAAGHDVARRIAGATLDIVPGMGHDLPAALLPRFADAIRANADRAGRAGVSARPAGRRASA